MTSEDADRTGRWLGAEGRAALAQVLRLARDGERWERALADAGLAHLDEVPGGRDLRGAPLDAAVLTGMDLSGADLSGADLRAARLVGARLSQSRLSGAFLAGADLSEAVMTGADLTSAHAAGVRADRADLSIATLADADLSGAHLRGAIFWKARLSQANLESADLTHAQLFGADLSGANLRGARLEEAYLREAQLRGAQLEGVSLFGAALPEAVLAGANLSRADLRGADLSAANLVCANLSAARLAGVQAVQASFVDAQLDDADLSGGMFQGAYFEGARLPRANLRNADLSAARFRGCRFEGAILDRATLVGALLWDADLYEAHLVDCNLERAELIGARLLRANLTRANLALANCQHTLWDQADVRDAVLDQAHVYGSTIFYARNVNTVRAARVNSGPDPDQPIWRDWMDLTGQRHGLSFFFHTARPMMGDLARFFTWLSGLGVEVTCRETGQDPTTGRYFVSVSGDELSLRIVAGRHLKGGADLLPADLHLRYPSGASVNIKVDEGAAPPRPAERTVAAGDLRESLLGHDDLQTVLSEGELDVAPLPLDVSVVAAGAGDSGVGLAPGERISDYLSIVRPLGQGGMGWVWEADDLQLGRKVAIKMIRTLASSDQRRLASLLEREARATARLNHPNIVTIFQSGTHRGAPYLVLELLEGQLLSERLEEAMPLAETLSVMRQVLAALAHAHGKGVLHRDLKPQNIYVTNEGLIKVLDFGLAELDTWWRGTEPPAAEEAGAGHRRQLAGTLAYIPPEQWSGARPSVSGDLWAAGVTFFELLTGRLPFTEEHGFSRGADKAPSVRALHAELPAWVDEIVSRALAIDQASRFQTAEQLAFAFEQGEG